MQEWACESRKTLVFITNNFSLPAATIFFKSRGDLVKITTFLVNVEDAAAAGAARAKYFGDARPGSATVIVKALLQQSWLIEIEAVAATST